MEVDLTRSVSANVLLFKIIGHWPIGNKKLYEAYRIFVLFGMVVYNTAQLKYVIDNMNDFEEVAATIYNLFSTVAVVLKISIFDHNFNMVKQIVNNLQCAEFQPKNVKQEEIVKTGIFKSNFVFYFFFTMANLTLVMWVFFPIMDGQRRLPSNAWFPYDYLSPKYYAVTYFVQSIFVIYHALTNVALDTLFAMLAIQVGVQCDVLGNQVSNICHGDHEDGGLVDCIKHHLRILDWAENLGSAFGNIVFVQFATSVSVLCETMVLLSLGDVFSASYAMLVFYQVAILTQIFLYCWFGNEVILKSEKLYYDAYLSDWINCGNNFKKNLLMFMMRAQRPIILYVGNVFPISVATYTSILRSSWAYFMALSKVHDNSEI